MMKPYYEENNIKIYNSDIMSTLKEVADESVDCAITSPPYWALRDYGIEPSIWDGDEKCKHKWGNEIKEMKTKNEDLGLANTGTGSPETRIPGLKAKGKDIPLKSQFCLKCNAWRGLLGLEPTFELYIKHLCDIFDEVKRVLKKSGTCWVNMGDTYGGSWSNYGARNCHQRKRNTHKYIRHGSMPKNWKPPTIYLPQKSLVQIPSRFSIEMTNRGWILRNEIIWHKPNCMPSSVRDRLTVDFEKIFFFTKDKKYWFERQLDIYSGPLNRWGGDKLKRETKKTAEYKDMLNIGKTSALRAGAKNLRPNPQGRNKRCVWKITTQPFKEAHFAVFPESLVETPIKSGCPEFVCNKCGKTKEKIYKITKPPEEMYTKSNLPDDGLINTGIRRDGKFRGSGQKVQNWKDQNPNQFKGYTSCKCKAGFSGGVVLDPFMGSGTVAAVAKRLNRQFIGIDIKKDYCKMAIKRIKNTEKDMFV